MSTLADVAAFAARHATCGGLIPRVHSLRGGGHMLAITCACGAVHERWVTADEARKLPSPDAPARAPEPEPPAPSYELVAALDSDVEPAPDAEPPPPPVTSPLPPPPVTAQPVAVFRPPQRPKATASASQTAAAIDAAPTVPATIDEAHPRKPHRWLVLRCPCRPPRARSGSVARTGVRSTTGSSRSIRFRQWD